MKVFYNLFVFFFLFTPSSIYAQDPICDNFDIVLETEGIFCGKTKGAIKVYIEGAVTNKIFLEWDNSNNSIWDGTHTFLPIHFIEDLPAGTYTVKATDKKAGCFVMKEIILAPNAVPEELELVGNPTKCNGLGSISVKLPKQKEAPYYFSLQGPLSASYVAPISEFTIYNLPAGSYEFNYEKEDCITTSNVIVPEGVEQPKINLLALSDICDTDITSLTAHITDGEAPYILSWEGPTNGSITIMDDTQELEGFETGDYQFRVIDAKGCTSATSLSLENLGMQVTLTTIDAICNQNGTLNINIEGGQAPYNIEWSGAGTGNLVSNEKEISLSLAPGTYIVRINDANDCKARESETLKIAPTDLFCSIIPLFATCNEDNGILDVFISGGSPPYTLQYEGPISGSVTVNGSVLIEDLPAGTYTTFLQDADGCSVSESSTIQIEGDSLAIADFSYMSDGIGMTVNFTNNSVNGESFEWDFGDGSSSTLENPSHTYDDLGAFEVCLNVIGSCNTSQQCQNIELMPPTRIGTLASSNNTLSLISGDNFEVQQNFPNPFSGETTIPFQVREAMDITITILHINGKVIEVQNAYFESGQHQYKFSKNSLPSGVYYYTFRGSDFFVSKKMVVK